MYVYFFSIYEFYELRRLQVTLKTYPTFTSDINFILIDDMKQYKAFAHLGVLIS